MKRTKRKYTLKPKLDAPESIPGPVKDESHISIPPDREGNPVLDSFTFNDLPFSIRNRVEAVIKMRKGLRLPDDSKDRKEMAIKMFRGDRPR